MSQGPWATWLAGGTALEPKSGSACGHRRAPCGHRRAPVLWQGLGALGDEASGLGKSRCPEDRHPQGSTELLGEKNVTWSATSSGHRFLLSHPKQAPADVTGPWDLLGICGLSSTWAMA